MLSRLISFPSATKMFHFAELYIIGFPTNRFSVGSPVCQYNRRLFAMRPFSHNTLDIPNVPFVVLYIYRKAYASVNLD